MASALVDVFIVGTTFAIKSTLSNSRGQYFISNLSNCEYIVMFSANNYVTLMFHIVIDAGETRTLNVSLIKGRN
ncbi:carboxypeptidase regulatory-like domain-containing protein [Priestia megaterium]